MTLNSPFMVKPSNVAELKQFCKEEWAKIPPQRCERLIASYHTRLIAVVAADWIHINNISRLDILFQNYILYLLGLSLCNIKICLMI